jgi:hypothetical protein
MSVESMPTSGIRRGAAALSLALTMLLGAFLLFLVQPLIGKFILPWFGGSPAVWTTCMLFFQLVLFGGYVYAHLSQSRLGPRGQALLHLALVAAALAALPVAPSPSWKPTGTTAPTLRILLLLLATVGLPYFALSATSPLVQAWFSRRYPGRSPYRLYALSNVGSLAALLSYPFLIEPRLDVVRQSWMWSGSFLIYAGLCAACLACLWELRHPAAGGPVAAADAPPAADEPATPSWSRRLLWLALPACASVLLLATTNHVCQDIAVIPFLWIVPLTLYLATFIIAFDRERWYARGIWATAAMLLILAVTRYEHTDDFFGRDLGPVPEIVLYFAAMFCACMVCHGELVRLRPAARHLTEFYLLISAGGALGGVFVSLLAPGLFRTFLEWPIGLFACYVIAAVALVRAAAQGRRPGVRTAVVLAAALAGLAGMAAWQDAPATAIDRARNFYGVVSVRERDRDDPARHRVTLWHGRIRHGTQFVDPARSRRPTAYYAEESGVGRALLRLRERGPARVGVIGLGIGTLAAYARPGDSYRFYEINPEVVRMAQSHFTYLRECRGRSEILLGDARLTLENEPPQGFQLLALDAFSGDAVPAHLLTREAFQVYMKHLAPGGVIAVNITNSYLSLAPVVRGEARACGLQTIRVSTPEDEARLVDFSDWMLLTADEGLVKAIPSLPPPDARDDFQVPLWTDARSDLFAILNRE